MKFLREFLSGSSAVEPSYRNRPRKFIPGSVDGKMHDIETQLVRCLREYNVYQHVDDNVRDYIQSQLQDSADASDKAVQEFIQDAGERAIDDVKAVICEKLGIEGRDELGKQENYADFLEGADDPEGALADYKAELQELLVNKFHERLGIEQPTTKSALKR